MIKRILRISGVILLLLVLVIAGGLSWVIGTESGFQQTLALAKKFAPGTLEWDEASGKLAGPLRVRGLHYSQIDGIDASVAALDFDWRPSALLGLELAVEQLQVDDVEVRLAEATDQQETTSAGGALTDISLPVSISLNDIAANNVDIYPAGQDTSIEIDRIALTGSAEQSDVQLVELIVIAPQGELQLEGTLKTRDDYPMDLTVSWQADIGLSTPLKGEGTMVGSLAQLQIDHQLKGFALADIEATVSNITKLPAWDASIEASIPEPGSLSALLTGTPQVTLQTSGTPDDFEAQATLTVATTETGPLIIDTDVSGSTEMLNIHSLLAKLSDNGGELSATGQIALATLQSDISGQWQDLSWPLKGEPQFTSAKGRFDATGSPDDFKANVSTDVDGGAIPEGQWIVSLVGSATALSNFTVKGQTLDGTITADGSASWESTPDWDVVLGAEGINPGKQWSEFPGSINLIVSSTGQIGEEGPKLTADIKRLSGLLREQPLSGSGRVSIAGEKLSIDTLNLTHGATQLDANGDIDNQIALDFDLSSPDLSTLLPELAGAISVAGSVSGSKDAPMLKASGNANNVAYAGNSVSELNFNVDAGLEANANSTLSVDVSGITAGSQQISDVNLNAVGSPSEHSVAFTAKTDQGDIKTQLDGSYLSNTWDGSLSSLQLENTPAGNWRLREPVAIIANAEKAETSELCLDNKDKLGSLCIDGNWLAAGESKATLSIKGLSPKLAAAYLPPGFVLATKLNGDATALLDTDGNLNAEARLTLDSGKLTLNADTSPVVIGLEQSTIDASWRGNNANLDLATAFTDFGNLNIQGSISDPAGEGKLTGSLDADFADLTLISAFAPQIQQISGTLKSNLSLSGTLQTPQVEGELTLRDFSAEIPETAMLIEDTQLIVKGNPDGTLLINGRSRSGDGQLDVKGSINPRTQALNIELIGDNFEVANTALMKAVVSPDLTIGMNNSGMQVNGKVTIPSAYINANGGNDGIKTVSASSDVVYVSEEGEQAATPASQLNLDIQLILGDSIEVEAGDFRGRLEGDLRIQQTPELAPRGTGTINVVNGDYVIYGQQLDMERGRILFSGGPVDNPSLDMEVARTVQEYDVVAGARIQGTAQAPRLELYSEPSMPDASILSFILLGQPPGTTGGSYTLGKYLTPDLYVSYGIGLFDAINTFNMRYKLTDKLSLEAASGSGSSADLIFTIEK